MTLNVQHIIYLAQSFILLCFDRLSYRVKEVQSRYFIMLMFAKPISTRERSQKKSIWYSNSIKQKYIQCFMNQWNTNKHITWLMLNYFHIWFHYVCRKAKFSHIVQMLNLISPRLSEIIYWCDPLNGYRLPVDSFNWNLIFFANFSVSITGLI